MHALRYAVGTDPGLRREANEDSVYFSDRLFAVADGMGGHAYGEVASSIAIAVLADLDPEADDPLGELNGAAREIAIRLTDLAEENFDMRGMGTTLTALWWDGERFAVGHIGDSRCYLVRDGELTQVTRDHTMVQALVDDGRMSAEQAGEHPGRSMLMRALQAGSAHDPDLFHQDAAEGDRYLICSDGLSDVVAPAEIAELLTASADGDETVRMLIEAANARGGPDNITCVVVDVVPAGNASWLPKWLRR
ncbi:PP2C family serine/threonine-protein phosphatase [Saccharothrix longispora]|uniref:PP2C family protein-serine/threonine phosphatase n=1 Tax=Saccharothrix longispora TaxID=33920 RepID=UPI0028FDBE66|nr:PP2C family serine/threonine-protein phosphatase [Saccharothrix longispora]MBY8851175.1 protein phosphatase 2C domain-containing protein [Saccharothrix sp. MB29]MDU0291664.1 PP2C family serine/threonine-protein phosphatase [Saccharothrix longispora]